MIDQVYELLPVKPDTGAMPLSEILPKGLSPGEISQKLGLPNSKVKKSLEGLQLEGYAIRISDDENHVTKWFRTEKPYSYEGKAEKISLPITGKKGKSPLQTRMKILASLVEGKQGLTAIFNYSGMSTKQGVKGHLDEMISKGYVVAVANKGTDVCPTCGQVIRESAYALTTKGQGVIKTWSSVKDKLEELSS